MMGQQAQDVGRRTVIRLLHGAEAEKSKRIHKEA
jgi:hypothetical protein